MLNDNLLKIIQMILRVLKSVGDSSGVSLIVEENLNRYK